MSTRNKTKNNMSISFNCLVHIDCLIFFVSSMREFKETMGFHRPLLAQNYFLMKAFQQFIIHPISIFKKALSMVLY